MNKLTALCAAALAGMMMVSTVSAQERRFVTLEYLPDKDPMFSGQPHGQVTIVEDPQTPNGSDGKVVIDVRNLFCLKSSNIRASYYSIYFEVENFHNVPRHLLVFNTPCSSGGWQGYHGELFRSSNELDAALDPLNQVTVRIYRLNVGIDDSPIVPNQQIVNPTVCSSLTAPRVCLVFEGTD